MNFGAEYLRLEYLSLRWGFGEPQWRGGEAAEPVAWMELTVHASSMSFFSCSWSVEQNSVFLSVKLRPLYDPFVSRFRQETRPARALSQYVPSGAGRCAKDLEKVKMLLVSFERMFS